MYIIKNNKKKKRNLNKKINIKYTDKSIKIKIKARYVYG